MRVLFSKPGLLGFLIAVALIPACSNDPTTTESRDPSLAETQVLTINGPTYATSLLRTTYTYTAYMGASYPQFLPWGVRFCPTKSITGCTVPWTTVYGTTINTYWNEIKQSFTGDCSGGGMKTFQVRAQARAFGVPTQTAYKVTFRCPNN